MFSRFQREIESLVDSAIQLSWYMRGGLQYHDAYDLTPFERDRIHSFIQGRMKTEANKPYPIY